MKVKQLKYTFLFSIAILMYAVMPESMSSRYTHRPGSGMVKVPLHRSSEIFPFSNFPMETDSETDPVIIPMKKAGRLFLIDALVDGEAGNLVFDTGANGLVLNSTYFRNHIKIRRVNTTGITGDAGSIGQITTGKIEFADLVFSNLTADMANLGHIEDRRGVKILGLFGFGILRNFEIVIDPVQSELKLFRIDRSGKRMNSILPEFKPDHSQKIEGSGNILFLKGTIGGKMLNFCFDTAAETNVISSNSNRIILSSLTITRRTELKGAGSAVSEVLFGRMNDFTIGTQKIGNMETVVTNLYALNEAYGTHIDGILGYSFLQHAIVCVNFMKSQVGILFTEGEEK